MIQTKVTKRYLISLEEIENFIFEVTSDFEELVKFHNEHNRVKQFIEQNIKTPPYHSETGDRSWPFANGRYRIFYKAIFKKENAVIYLLDIIDNRMLNLNIYPENSLASYCFDE